MLRTRYRRAAVAIAVLLLVSATALEALQRFRGRGRRFSSVPEGFDSDVKAEFYFTRLAYNGGGGGWGRRGGGWTTDYPDAEYHFMQGVKRLTNVDASPGGKIVQPLDDEIFEYPWIYAVEVGRWYLDDEEAAKMREYLLRGGFLMVDDFHGTYQWASFIESMERVFPDRPITEIQTEHPILHVLYDLDQRTQIPGLRHLRAGPGGETVVSGAAWPPIWRGIYDDEGRLLVAINFNQDVGDAWEHADWPQYPEPMTALAYRFGINYIIYAMTH